MVMLDLAVLMQDMTGELKRHLLVRPDPIVPRDGRILGFEVQEVERVRQFTQLIPNAF